MLSFIRTIAFPPPFEEKLTAGAIFLSDFCQLVTFGLSLRRFRS
jgi:hypothetical protein